MRKVFGIGETILDIIFRNDQPQKAVPGGSVFNGLISLGRLNVPVSFISELGNDRVGDMIRDFMEDNHITTEFVDRFPDGKSPISLAFLDDDKNANYIFYKDYPAQRLEVPLPKIEKDDIFVFGSYYSLNPVLRTRMVEFLQYAQERKAIIYYRPNFARHTLMRRSASCLPYWKIWNSPTSSGARTRTSRTFMARATHRRFTKSIFSFIVIVS